jgi:hypothetical protein
VVPLAREVYRGQSYRVVLISLEVWSGWLDLRYVLLPEEPYGPPQFPGLDWRIADDAGTAYQVMGMAHGGGRLLHVIQEGFRPAFPEGARTLTLTLTDGETSLAVVEIDLVAGD